jgi:hypothetical protein
LGWINRELVAGKPVEHMNAYGGEDRFWLGPEGGQFSIFFAKGVPFDLEHWYTPAPVDTEAWELVSMTGRASLLRKTMRSRTSRAVFEVGVERTSVSWSGMRRSSCSAQRRRTSRWWPESNNKVVIAARSPGKRPACRSGFSACSIRPPDTIVSVCAGPEDQRLLPSATSGNPRSLVSGWRAS